MEEKCKVLCGNLEISNCFSTRVCKVSVTVIISSIFIPLQCQMYSTYKKGYVNCGPGGPFFFDGGIVANQASLTSAIL